MAVGAIEARGALLRVSHPPTLRKGLPEFAIQLSVLAKLDALIGVSTIANRSLNIGWTAIA